MRERSKAVLIVFFMAATLVAGCGGGGGGSPAVLPVATPTTATQSAPQQVTIPNAGGPVPMPAVAGYTPTLSVPAGTTGTAQAQTFTVLPAGIPALSVGRRTESFSGNLFLLLSLTTTSAITFASSPSISIVLPAGFPTANVQFQLAGLAPGATAWQENIDLGTYNASTNTVTYPPGSGSFTLPAGTSYLAFYTIPAIAPSPTSSPTTAPTSSPTTAPTSSPTTAPTASPTTAPTASPTTAPTASPTTAPTASPTTAPTASPTTAPTASPTTAPTASPIPTSAPVVVKASSLSFTATGTSNAQTVLVSESGYGGSFTPSTNCSAVATTTAGPNLNQFTITPVAAGTCTETFSDANNNSGSLQITVTTTSVGGQ